MAEHALATPPLVEVEPEEMGLCAERLERARVRLSEEVDAGEVHGVVAIVSRAGRVAWSISLGTLDGLRPMRADAIFRIYSMTKPIASLAAMTLHEEGRLQLSDPLGTHLPELAELTVLEGERGVVPARRQPTVKDVLLHTAGFSGGERGSEAIMRRYAAAGIERWDHTTAADAFSSQGLVERLAAVPLAHHPGSAWEYSRGGDVLGRLVEVVSGEPLDSFCASRIFAPAGMDDSGWHLGPDAVERLAEPAPTAGHRVPTPRDPTAPPRFLSAGSGAFSTAGDYLRFAQMLLDGGAGRDDRVVSRKTIELIGADHLGPLRETGPDYLPGPGYGFGLGLAVRGDDGADIPGSPGDLWWLGRAGTSFFVDPKEELVGVLMLQKHWRAVHYQRLFRNLVYQAVID